MVILSALVACCTGLVESLACTVKLNAPAAVGVPENWPVEAFRVSPPGKAPTVTLQVTGEMPPLKVSVEL